MIDDIETRKARLLAQLEKCRKYPPCESRDDAILALENRLEALEGIKPEYIKKTAEFEFIKWKGVDGPLS